MRELESVRSNLKKSEKLIDDVLEIISYGASGEERVIVEESVSSLLQQLSIINNSSKKLVERIKAKVPKHVRAESGKAVERIETSTGSVYISKQEKERFLRELGLEKQIKKIKTRVKKEGKTTKKFTLPNKIFYPLSLKLARKDLFKGLQGNLVKANMPYLLTSYISLILFFSFIALVLGIFAAIIFTNSLVGAFRNLVLALLFTALVFFLMFYYPHSAVSSNKKKIEAELPFAVAHMAAIASSNVEPSRIFSIMTIVTEYKIFSIELRRIVNQVNLYGYDLVTALKNTAKTTSSRKFADLLNGISTTIVTYYFKFN